MNGIKLPSKKELERSYYQQNYPEAFKAYQTFQKYEKAICLFCAKHYSQSELSLKTILETCSDTEFIMEIKRVLDAIQDRNLGLYRITNVDHTESIWYENNGYVRKISRDQYDQMKQMDFNGKEFVLRAGKVNTNIVSVKDISIQDISVSIQRSSKAKKPFILSMPKDFKTKSKSVKLLKW